MYKTKCLCSLLIIVIVSFCDLGDARTRLLLSGSKHIINSADSGHISSPNSLGHGGKKRLILGDHQLGRNTCSDCVCGIGRSSRIVEGELADPAEFPWAVAVHFDAAQHCGGTLITRRHVLTAAHCLDGYDPVFMTIYLADGSRQKAIRSVKHKDFGRYNYDNDIGILELARPVKFDANVRPVCLPTTDSIDDTGMTGVAIGWGQIGPEREVSKDLQKADLPIMSRSQCHQRTGYAKQQITESMFCAGYLKGGADSCKGDSGGPLHVRRPRGNMEVIGITSWGKSCGKPNFPGIYTKVSKFINWIAQQVNGECLCTPP